MEKFLSTKHWRSNEEYFSYKDRLFRLACQFAKSKPRQKDEGLINGSGSWTARGRFWRDSLRTGQIPDNDQLDLIAEQAAERFKVTKSSSAPASTTKKLAPFAAAKDPSAATRRGVPSVGGTRRQNRSKSRTRPSTATSSSSQQQAATPGHSRQQTATPAQPQHRQTPQDARQLLSRQPGTGRGGSAEASSVGRVSARARVGAAAALAATLQWW